MSPLYLVALALFAVASQAVPLELDEVLAGDERTDNFDERGPYEGGDMIIPPEQRAESRAGISGSRYRWTKGQIPYVMGSGFTSSELKTINDAISEIQTKTCIRFVRRASQADYITITRGGSGSGCWSYVGRQGGNQQVNLQAGNPGCIFKGIVAHELIHAIGYFHEQSRTDRDDYVTINWENIQSGTEHNFDKYSSSQVNPFGVTYDFGSIMHYSATAFSKNGQQTITPKQSGVSASSLGQRSGLSAKDAQKINAMYQGVC